MLSFSNETPIYKINISLDNCVKLKGSGFQNGVWPGVSLNLTKSANKPENQIELRFSKRREVQFARHSHFSPRPGSDQLTSQEKFSALDYFENVKNKDVLQMTNNNQN